MILNLEILSCHLKTRLEFPHQLADNCKSQHLLYILMNIFRSKVKTPKKREVDTETAMISNMGDQYNRASRGELV